MRYFAGFAFARRPVLQTAAVEEKRYEMPRKRSLTADAEETVTPLAGAPLVPQSRLDLAACFGDYPDFDRRERPRHGRHQSRSRDACGAAE